MQYNCEHEWEDKENCPFCQLEAAADILKVSRRIERALRDNIRAVSDYNEKLLIENKKLCNQIKVEACDCTCCRRVIAAMIHE